MIIKAEEMEKVMYGDRVKEFIPEKKNLNYSQTFIMLKIFSGKIE